MDIIRLTVFVLLMCAMCRPAYTVKLTVWFLYDSEFDAMKSFNVIEAAPEAIWRRIKNSGLLRGHLNKYTVQNGDGCSLRGARRMMSNFTSATVNNVHAFIGPICSYMCDLTGMISSAYSIPQVCSSTLSIFVYHTSLKFRFNILVVDC